MENLTAGFLYRAGAETPLNFREKCSSFSQNDCEQFTQRWIPKPQFWYPPLMFGSQHRIPKHLFFLGFLRIHLRTPRPATEPRNGPTRNFHEKCRKNSPQAEILDPKKIPRKYRKNTQNGHFWYFGGIFSVFSGYFEGKFRESRISGRGGIFSVFFVEIPGRAISGLCSRSGCSQVYTADFGFSVGRQKFSVIFLRCLSRK